MFDGVVEFVLETRAEEAGKEPVRGVGESDGDRRRRECARRRRVNAVGRAFDRGARRSRVAIDLLWRGLLLIVRRGHRIVRGLKWRVVRLRDGRERELHSRQVQRAARRRAERHAARLAVVRRVRLDNTRQGACAVLRRASRWRPDRCRPGRRRVRAAARAGGRQRSRSREHRIRRFLADALVLDLLGELLQLRVHFARAFGALPVVAEHLSVVLLELCTTRAHFTYKAERANANDNDSHRNIDLCVCRNGNGAYLLKREHRLGHRVLPLLARDFALHTRSSDSGTVNALL